MSQVAKHSVNTLSPRRERCGSGGCLALTEVLHSRCLCCRMGKARETSQLSHNTMADGDKAEGLAHRTGAGERRGCCGGREALCE